MNLLLLTYQGQWGVTAAEEEEENKRIREFRDSIPKMCSQLQILTHFYQVSVSMRRGVCFREGVLFQRMGGVAHVCAGVALRMQFLGGGPPAVHPCAGLSSGQPSSWDEKPPYGRAALGSSSEHRCPDGAGSVGLLERSKP